MVYFFFDISFVGLIVFIVLAIRAKTKETGKAKRMWIYAMACFVILAICFPFVPESSQSTRASSVKQNASISTKQTVSSSQKPVAQKKTTSSKSKKPAIHPISDQYLEDFLAFMDQFHTDLLQEVKDDQSQSDIAVFLSKENAEGWKQYDKINSQPTPSTDSQFEQRVDVLNAWQSLFEWDMDYIDSNVDLSTINEKEKVFLSAYDKANSNFAKK